MTIRKELKKEPAREEWKKLIARVGEEPRKIGQKKKSKTFNSYRWYNTQLLTIGD